MAYNTEWEQKWLREGWAMPFGSMCNAYGQVNQQKGKTIEAFLEDIDKIFNKAQDITINTLNEAKPALEKPITDQARVAAVDKFEKNYKDMTTSEGIRREALEADRLPTVDIKDL